MEKFKVGDMVRIVKAIGPMKRFLNREGVIKEVALHLPYPYKVDFGGEDGAVFLEEEIEHSKEYKVLEILRKWQESR